jgi:hypothetical protein
MWDCKSKFKAGLVGTIGRHAFHVFDKNTSQCVEGDEDLGYHTLFEDSGGSDNDGDSDLDIFY